MRARCGTDTFIRTLGWRAVAEKEVELLDEADARLLPGLRRRRERLPGSALRRRHLARVRRARPAEPRLHARASGPRPTRSPGSRPWPGTCARTSRTRSTARCSRRRSRPAEVAQLHPDYPFDTHPTIVGGAVAAPAPVSSAPLSNAPLSDGDRRTPPRQRAPVLRQLQSHPRRPARAHRTGRATRSARTRGWSSGALTDTGTPILANDPHLGAVHALGLVPGGPALRRGDRGLSVRRGRLQLLRRARRHHRPQRARSRGASPTSGPTSPTSTWRRSRATSTSSTAPRSPCAPHTETIKVAGGDPVDDRDPLDRARPARHRASRTPSARSRRTIRHPPTCRRATTSCRCSGRRSRPGRTASVHLRPRQRQRTGTSSGLRPRVFDVPSQNLLYADIDGNIGYQAPGLIPDPQGRRRHAAAARLDERERLERLHPVRRRCRALLNPASGLIVTANNAAVGRGLPARSSRRTGTCGYRAQQITTRLQDVIAATKKITMTTWRRSRPTTSTLNAAALAPIIAKLKLSGDATEGRGAAREVGPPRRRRQRGGRLLQHDSGDTCSTTMFDDKLPEGTRPAGGDRWFGVVGSLLDEPDSPWWTNEKLGIDRPRRHARLRGGAGVRRGRRVDGGGSEALVVGQPAHPRTHQRQLRRVGHRPDRMAVQPRTVLASAAARPS